MSFDPLADALTEMFDRLDAEFRARPDVETVFLFAETTGTFVGVGKRSAKHDKSPQGWWTDTLMQDGRSVIYFPNHPIAQAAIAS